VIDYWAPKKGRSDILIYPTGPFINFWVCKKRFGETEPNPKKSPDHIDKGVFRKPLC
jgi:hypothetical protein